MKNGPDKISSTGTEQGLSCSVRELFRRDRGFPSLLCLVLISLPKGNPRSLSRRRREACLSLADSAVAMACTRKRRTTDIFISSRSYGQQGSDIVSDRIQTRREKRFFFSWPTKIRPVGSRSKCMYPIHLALVPEATKPHHQQHGGANSTQGCVVGLTVVGKRSVDATVCLQPIELLHFLGLGRLLIGLTSKLQARLVFLQCIRTGVETSPRRNTCSSVAARSTSVIAARSPDRC